MPVSTGARARFYGNNPLLGHYSQFRHSLVYIPFLIRPLPPVSHFPALPSASAAKTPLRHPRNPSPGKVPGVLVRWFDSLGREFILIPGKLKPATDFSNFSGFFSFVVSSGDKKTPPACHCQHQEQRLITCSFSYSSVQDSLDLPESLLVRGVIVSANSIELGKIRLFGSWIFGQFEAASAARRGCEECGGVLAGRRPGRRTAS